MTVHHHLQPSPWKHLHGRVCPMHFPWGLGWLHDFLQLLERVVGLSSLSVVTPHPPACLRLCTAALQVAHQVATAAAEGLPVCVRRSTGDAHSTRTLHYKNLAYSVDLSHLDRIRCIDVAGLCVPLRCWA